VLLDSVQLQFVVATSPLPHTEVTAAPMVPDKKFSVEVRVTGPPTGGGPPDPSSHTKACCASV
jgi:hypothetical protein